MFLEMYDFDFAQISPKSNQVCPNLINFVQKNFPLSCGCIPSSNGTDLTSCTVLTELCIYRFMRLEKPRLRDEWLGTQKDKMKNMKILSQLEEQLKDTLAGDARLLNDLSVTKKLAEIKKQHDEATEMYEKKLFVYVSLIF